MRELLAGNPWLQKAQDTILKWVYQARPGDSLPVAEGTLFTVNEGMAALTVHTREGDRKLTREEIYRERADVLAEKGRIEEEVRVIKCQQEEARKEWAPQQWWDRSTRALRIKQGQVQTFMARLTVLKNLQKQLAPPAPVPGDPEKIAERKHKQKTLGILYSIAGEARGLLRGSGNEEGLQAALADLDNHSPGWH